ncbi:GNAT family N-acetyltransferase [Sphingomonas sp. OK281]|uniref:GNAT family N-acetyltransferase n=1 Tax=Sphingomonas sp. OK281 TaxID=1881067 RepID=UPI0008DFDD48|nr:GNAT family N-acetyltransferase [Sphingomonas sp. OK281]SFO48493.1 Acetyltransferase (GNAT) domain-containing protein [Sphingomonas sp. OK281]
MAMIPVDLPPALVAQGIALRQERDDDILFLTELYASTRAGELELLPHWTDSDKAAFVVQQFAAQRHHYRTTLTDVHFAVVEHGGQPIARLYVQLRRNAMQLIDITLRPERRGAGLGSALITAVIDSAVRRRLDVGLFVERYSAALPLYRRLGFTTLAEHDIYLEMERRQDAGQLKTAS